MGEKEKRWSRFGWDLNGFELIFQIFPLAFQGNPQKCFGWFGWMGFEAMFGLELTKLVCLLKCLVCLLVGILWIFEFFHANMVWRVVLGSSNLALGWGRWGLPHVSASPGFGGGRLQVRSRARASCLRCQLASEGGPLKEKTWKVNIM